MSISEILIIFFTVLATVGISIGIYYAVTGSLPGAKTVVKVTEPPVTSTGLDPGQLKFMFFYAEWCPFSSNVVEAWRSLKQDYKNNPAKYKGRIVVFEDVDGDHQAAKKALYNVEAYPTFKIEANKKVYELTGNDRSFSRLQSFLIDVIDKSS
jgi:hypothetical protein